MTGRPLSAACDLMAANPSAESIRRAQVFWEQSGEDLKAAKAELKRRDFLQSSFMSLQAAVNALSAVCHLHGHFQLPPGNPGQLAALCAETEPRFTEWVDACPALEEAMERNPFDPHRDPEEEAVLGRRCLAEVEPLLRLVKSYLKENRARFFKP